MHNLHRNRQSLCRATWQLCLEHVRSVLTYCMVTDLHCMGTHYLHSKVSKKGLPSCSRHTLSVSKNLTHKSPSKVLVFGKESTEMDKVRIKLLGSPWTLTLEVCLRIAWWQIYTVWWHIIYILKRGREGYQVALRALLSISMIQTVRKLLSFYVLRTLNADAISLEQ